MLAGDERTGISIMLMDAGLDTGPELLRRELTIGPRETGGELHDRLAPLGAEAIVAAVQGWAIGSIHPTPQPAAGATYAAKIRKDEARIDWSQVGGGNRSPGPCVQSVARRRDAARRSAGADLGGAPGDCGISLPRRGALPGTVVPAPAGRIVVATGDGLLELLTLQFPGRKPLKARDVLNSRPLGGERFGEVKT